MKKNKLLALLMGLTLVLLAACGGQSAPPDDRTADLAAFYTAVSKKHEMQTGMEPVPEDMVEIVYPGLTALEAKQRVLHMAMITMASQEVALVELTREEDVEAAKAIFQTRIDQQAEGGAWYPAAMEAWEKDSRVVSSGNYVLMVVHQDADDIVEEFHALFA